MPPLPPILTQYIVKTDVKVNKSNLKTFCKPCIDGLGEEKGHKVWFPNKKDRIIQHFKKCPNFFARTNEEERENIFACLQPNNNTQNSVIPQKRPSSLASISSSKVDKRSLYYGPMDNFIVRSLSKEDVQKFHMLLLRLIVSCGWALSWVNNPEAKELFDFLNPFIKLPDRCILGGDILKQVVSEADKVMETTLKEDPVGITMTFDGWTNVKNEQLLGTVLISFEGRPYVWKAVDISAERENFTALQIVHWHTQQLGARCEIFKESTEFKTTIDRAIRLATYYKNSNHKFFIAHLKEHLLKTQQALQILAINYKPPIVETCRQGGALTLPREIFEIIDSSTFWDQLILINEILEPYCKILSNVLQCDKTRLFQVVHSMNYLIQFWLEYPDDILATQMINRLEKRWKDWEQPILLLSYLLHPEYRMNQFNNSIPNVNYSEFGKWLIVSTNELGLVACRIFSICVNAASIERLWSCMGFLQTKRHNRLMSSKALQMSKLRADITYSHRLYNNPTSIEPTLDIDDTNKTDVNQNPSSLENSKDNDPVGILEDSSDPIGEDSDEETTELPLENDFGEYLQGWAEMLEEEENVGFDEESSEENDISLDDVTHPANDMNAKWPLAILFNNDISIGLLF
ncbi:unnamed protein product [Rhizophagus irregularis]|nr:unnamed protein product [Rhizophagus irregularis]